MVNQVQRAWNESREKTQTATVLAFLSVVMIFVALGLLFFVKIPTENKSTIDILIGAMLSQGFSGVYNYYFGDSKGAQAQRESLVRIAESDLPNSNASTAAHPVATTTTTVVATTPMPLDPPIDGKDPINNEEKP